MVSLTTETHTMEGGGEYGKFNTTASDKKRGVYLGNCYGCEHEPSTSQERDGTTCKHENDCVKANLWEQKTFRKGKSL